MHTKQKKLGGRINQISRMRIRILRVIYIHTPCDSGFRPPSISTLFTDTEMDKVQYKNYTQIRYTITPILAPTKN